MNKIILSPKYKLLFKDLEEVRTVLLAGRKTDPEKVLLAVYG
jgi:hypothetical protein